MPFATDHDDLSLVHEPTPEGHTRVKLVRDGVEISGASIVPMTVRIGTAQVRMDGIGGVETDEAHRMKGLSRRVLAACIGTMKAGDAPLTTLYGIPGFYTKFGYATLGPEPVVSLPAAIPEPLPAGFAARRMEIGDLAAVRSLYDAGMGQATGLLLRADDAPSWRELAASIVRGEDEARVVTDASGAVVAYAWQARWCWWMRSKYRDEPAALRLAEAGAASPAAADALLDACRGWAGGRALETVQWMVPPDGRIGVAAALRGATIRLNHTFEGESMGRSLDVAALLRALEPELARRWRQRVPSWTGRLIIETGEDRAGLSLAAGQLAIAEADALADATVVALGPGDVARLVFGGFPPEELLARAGIGEPVATALATLFPQGFPYISPPDRF